MRSPNFLVAALLGGVLLFLSGCGSTPKPAAYNIKVTLDGSLEGSSVQVDLIGANATSDLPRWEAYSITEYWQPGNVVRRDANKAMFEFGPGKSGSQVLTAADPRWKGWLEQGALFVVLLVDLPGVLSDQPGAADPRRLIIPLDRAQWKGGTDTLEVLVQESGVRLVTPKKS